VATILAMSAVRNNDQVGLLIATSEVERFVPPRKGRRHAMRLLRDLLAHTPANTGTDLVEAIGYAQRILSHRSLVFIFSDFQLGDSWEAFGKALGGLRARHDVVASRLSDPGDFELPDVGMLRTIDPETGERVLLDTSRHVVRERFATLLNLDDERGRRTFARLGIDEIRLDTNSPYAKALITFFRRRERRLQR
jgi:uncharacterized protein (DUF58 family)